MLFSSGCDAVGAYDDTCHGGDGSGWIFSDEGSCVAAGYTWGNPNDICDHVGLLALCAVTRFVLVLICLICSCMGVCCCKCTTNLHHNLIYGDISSTGCARDFRQRGARPGTSDERRHYEQYAHTRSPTATLFPGTSLTDSV